MSVERLDLEGLLENAIINMQIVEMMTQYLYI